jgi:hypothetical protein
MDLSGTSMTLNVNNLGAKPVYFFDGVRAFSATAPYTHALLSGQTYQALYSGTAFYLLAQNGGVKAAALAIPTSAWVASTAYSGYPYQATVAVPGVQASGKGSTGSICFDAASYFVASEAGLLSPFVTGNGSITVYAAKVPAAALAGVMTII